jgi:hypothetical protein
MRILYILCNMGYPELPVNANLEIKLISRTILYAKLLCVELPVLWAAAVSNATPSTAERLGLCDRPHQTLPRSNRVILSLT